MEVRASLYPEGTQIIDFAYDETHEYRSGNFPLSRRSSSSTGDYEYADERPYSADEINRRAVALFDFSPENDNEVGLREGQVIWISYRHGQGWLVAEDPETGENGLVPEEYVDIFHDEVTDDVPKPFMPKILQEYHEEDSEWEDTDYEEDKPHTQNAESSSAPESPEVALENGKKHANDTISALEAKVKAVTIGDLEK